MSHLDEIFSSDERCSSAEKVSSAENSSSAEKFSSDEFGRNRRAFFEVRTDERTPKRFRPVSASDEPKWTNRIRSPEAGHRRNAPAQCLTIPTRIRKLPKVKRNRFSFLPDRHFLSLHFFIDLFFELISRF